jgi:BirA family biotin operon repressor/biotin-[acetyl-CoA-carboxylase] ligase
MQLDPRASAAGVRLFEHDLVGSTNAEALALVRTGLRGPLWITARRQSAGRGRRGRSWISQPGNLFATLLLTDPPAAEHWPEFSLVAALAIHDALVDCAPNLRPQFAIKWPNDVLLDGAKLGGILVEGEAPLSGASESDAGAVVIGIGVNCTTHPDETEFPATDLAAAGVEVSAETLFSALSIKMLGRLAQWNRGAHFSTVRTDWLARAAGLGCPIRLRLADAEVSGTFETIDEAGRLLLALADGGRRTIASADVVALEGMARPAHDAPGGED